MGRIRIATFNVENLLQRFDFYRYGRLTVEPALRILGAEDDDDYFTIRKALYAVNTDDARQMTAQAIREAGADVVCLQEVDSRDVLDDFHAQYVEKSAGIHYGWRRLIEGNDNRGIDVGVMAIPRIRVTSHAGITFADFNLFNDDLRDYGLSEGDAIFRRDCLEVELEVDNVPLTLFVCHFKSMSGSRDDTRPVRHAEAAAVRRIIENKFANPADEDWLVVGDLNDYTEGNHGLTPLLQGDFSINLVESLPAGDRWTHYYPRERSKHQLDYILASPSVAGKNPQAQPDIIRAGQPYRVPEIENVHRYPRVGFDRPKASDHCPVAVTLEI